MSGILTGLNKCQLEPLLNFSMFISKAVATWCKGYELIKWPVICLPSIVADIQNRVHSN